MIERRVAALKLRRELLADVVFADESRQIGERPQSLHTESGLVILILDGKQRTAFHPAMADADILREALRIIGRLQELVRAPDVVPLVARESEVAALRLHNHSSR